MINGNKIREVIREAGELLKGRCDEPLREARLLMRACLQVDDAEMVLRMEAPCGPQVREQYDDWVRRRAAGEPMAYILGHREFMKLDFLVRPGVLIPRPDTETLCEWVIERAPQRARILDLCTGSGCIGISLAHALPQSKVCCVDISSDALDLTRQNSMRLGVDNRLEVMRVDLRTQWPFPEKTYHIITANPPYIPTTDIATLETDVKSYEPHLALDGGSDGLAFYETIARQAAVSLTSKGMLAMEVGIGQADEVMCIMRKYLENVHTVNDLQGIPRVVIGYKRKPDYAGHRDRVRQNALAGGLENMRDYELLELLLFYAIPQKDTKPKAKELLRDVGTIADLIDMDAEDLMLAGKLTANSALLFSVIRQIMHRYRQEKAAPKTALHTWRDVGRYVAARVPNEKVESLYLLCMDTQRQVIRLVKLQKGVVDSVPVQIREITHAALRTEAKNVVLIHNHPSGNLMPSESDIELTEKVVRALEVNEINVIDHIIVGWNGDYCSMEQEGCMPE